MSSHQRRQKIDFLRQKAYNPPIAEASLLPQGFRHFGSLCANTYIFPLCGFLLSALALAWSARCCWPS